MVTTHASSRGSTPDQGTSYTERLRTSARRSTTAPIDGGTPSSKSRAKRAGPTAVARTGNTSHAYGTSCQALSSSVARRTGQGFSSALNDELVDQAAERTLVLSPVAEEEHPSSRPSTAVSNASSSGLTSADSEPNNGALVDKSYSHNRETGVVFLSNADGLPHGQPAHLKDQQVPLYERVGAAAFHIIDGIEEFLRIYWTLLLGVLLALTFGSLLAIFGVPTLGRVLSGTSIPSPVYGPDGTAHVTTTIVSYVSGPSDRAIASRINHLESRITFLEDELARNQASNSPLHAPFNHISASIGTTILPGVTSMTKSTVSWLLIPLSKFWTPPGMKAPITALQSWSEPGECWCTPADKAALGVHTPYPLEAAAVTIEHVLEEDLLGSGADLGTAPRLVEVWARVTTGQEQQGECRGEAPEKGQGWSCLGRLEIAHHVRNVRSWTMDLTLHNVASQDFVFRVLENVGNAEATCLYRVQLHGTKM